MKPTTLLLFAALWSPVVTTLADQHQPNRPPNILFIAIDDLKPIGSVFAEDPGNFLQRVYPDKALRTEVANRMTPNLQRLADSGISFMDAYCASPACNPSRAALMTGIRPHHTGLTTNASAVFFREFEYEGKRPLANAKTIPEYLKENGWYTASTGKIFHSGNNYALSDGARSWTHWTNVGGNAGAKQASPWCTDRLDWGQEGDDAAHYRQLNDYRKADFMARLLENGEATDQGTTFNVSDDQPFFLALGIFRPHLPFYATKDLLDLFPPEEMSITRALLDEFTQDADDLPQKAFTFSGMARNEAGDPIIGTDRFTQVLSHGLSIEPKDGDLIAWKSMLTHYFASCAIADRAVGRVLDGLQNSPYHDNTLIILWSDHGYHLGEKLHATKFALWDDAAQVNLFIQDPRSPDNAGKKCYEPVGLIDLFPTVMAAAGLELPSDRITGHDLTPLLINPRGTRSMPAQSTYQHVSNNMVRTQQHKLIVYNDGSRELYDMHKDPEEFKNLAGRRSHASIERKMKQIHDQVLDPNDDAE